MEFPESRVLRIGVVGLAYIWVVDTTVLVLIVEQEI